MINYKKIEESTATDWLFQFGPKGRYVAQA